MTILNPWGFEHPPIEKGHWREFRAEGSEPAEFVEIDAGRFPEDPLRAYIQVTFDCVLDGVSVFDSKRGIGEFCSLIGDDPKLTCDTHGATPHILVCSHMAIQNAALPRREPNQERPERWCAECEAELSRCQWMWSSDVITFSSPELCCVSCQEASEI